MSVQLFGAGADPGRYLSRLLLFEASPGEEFELDSGGLNLDSTAVDGLQAGWEAGCAWLAMAIGSAPSGLRLRVSLASSAGGSPSAVVDRSYSASSLALTVATALSLPLDPAIAVSGTVSVGDDGRIESQLPRELNLKVLALTPPAQWLLALGGEPMQGATQEQSAVAQEGRLQVAPTATAFLSFLCGPALASSVGAAGNGALARELVIEALSLCREARFLPPDLVAGMTRLRGQVPEVEDLFASPLAYAAAPTAVVDRYMALGCIGAAARNHRWELGQSLLCLYPEVFSVSWPGVRWPGPFVLDLLRGCVTLADRGRGPAELGSALAGTYDFVSTTSVLAGGQFEPVEEHQLLSFVKAVTSPSWATDDVRRRANAIARALGTRGASWVEQIADPQSTSGQTGAFYVHVQYRKEIGRDLYSPGAMQFEEAAAPGRHISISNPVLLNESISLVGATSLWLSPFWREGARVRAPAGWHAEDGPFEGNKVFRGGEIGRSFGAGLVLDTAGLWSNNTSRGLGRGIAWRDGEGVWPPSIDSFHVLGYLAANLEEESLDSIVDIGCGSGVLGLAAAYWGGRGRQVSAALIDAQPEAVRTAQANAARVSPAIQPIVSVGSAQQSHLLGGDRTYDLCICAPPYLPKTRLLKGPLWPAVAGTELLEWTAKNAFRFARRLVLQFSELCIEQVQPLLKEGDRVTPLGLAAFAIPPYAVYCQMGADLQARGDDLREVLEQAKESELTAGLRHFRACVLPHLLDVARPGTWPNQAEWEWARHKPYRFFHRLYVLDRHR